MMINLCMLCWAFSRCRADPVGRVGHSLGPVRFGTVFSFVGHAGLRLHCQSSYQEQSLSTARTVITLERMTDIRT